MKDLARFGRDLVNTTDVKAVSVREKTLNCTIYSPTDTDHEVYLRLRRDVVVTSGTCSTLEADLLLLLRKVALDIGLGTLEDHFALCLGGLREQTT